jgi:flagellar basal body-associated protein FliL
MSRILLLLLLVVVVVTAVAVAVLITAVTAAVTQARKVVPNGSNNASSYRHVIADISRN